MTLAWTAVSWARGSSTRWGSSVHGAGPGTNGIRQQGHRRLPFWASALRTDRDLTPGGAVRRNASSRHAAAARFTEKAAGPSWLLLEEEDMAVVVAAASTESAPLSPTLPISTSGALRRALPWPTFSSPTSPPPAARGRCTGDTTSPHPSGTSTLSSLPWLPAQGTYTAGHIFFIVGEIK